MIELYAKITSQFNSIHNLAAAYFDRKEDKWKHKTET